MRDQSALSHYRPAVGYLRRSTDRQEQSIGDQRRVIDAWAVGNGYEVLDYYTDDAISGASSDGRAAFLKLIADAKRPGCLFQFVLVYDIKRFGRVDNDEAGYYRYQLRRNGVDIIYVSEGFNGDDTDDLLRPVKQWQARQELKDLSKVTIRGLVTRAEGGWWNGGMPPYGYDLAYYAVSGDFLCTVRFMSDGSKQALDAEGNITRSIPKGEQLQFSKRDKSLLVLGHPERVRIVRQIFDWYVLEGLGYKSIADRLNQLSIPTPTGGTRRTSLCAKWCATTVMSILQNRLYVGDMIWNRLSFAKFHKITNLRPAPTHNFPGGLQIGEELDKVEARLREVRQTIANLIDNLTTTNRDFVDARLVELKRESAVLESRRLELEAAGAKGMEIDRLIDQAVQLAGEFDSVYAGGTIQEKRLLVRAFVKEIVIEPENGEVKVVLAPLDIEKGQTVGVRGGEIVRKTRM